MLKFKYVGGYLDGLEVSEQSDDPEHKRYFHTANTFTEGGQVGKFYNTLPEEELQNLLASKMSAKDKTRRIMGAMDHRYEATNRDEADGDILVTLTARLVIPKMD